MVRINATKYPSEIMGGVKKALKLSHEEFEAQIEAMTKVDVMDKYLESFEKEISGSDIFHVVNQVFGFDLDSMSVLSEDNAELLDASSSTEVPLSRVVIDSHLDYHGTKITGTDIRRMVNQIFGINLNGVSLLEGAGISLYSKGQWVLQSDKDLFVVYTGSGDLDVKVFPTEYFTKQTGLEALPDDLQESLTKLGFYYDDEKGSYYFLDPTAEAVSDEFKGQTIGAIVQVIRPSYAHI